jgi:putative membrane protein
VISLLTLGAAPARAQGPSALPDLPSSPDERLLATLHSINRTEMRLGKLAEKRAQSWRVKRFAGKMIEEHADLDRDVMAEVGRQRLDLSYVPDVMAGRSRYEHRRQRLSTARLFSASGSEFDHAFMQTVVEGHHQSISQVEALQDQTERRSSRLASRALKLLKKQGARAGKILASLERSTGRGW